MLRETISKIIIFIQREETNPFVGPPVTLLLSVSLAYSTSILSVRCLACTSISTKFQLDLSLSIPLQMICHVPFEALDFVFQNGFDALTFSSCHMNPTLFISSDLFFFLPNSKDCFNKLFFCVCILSSTTEFRGVWAICSYSLIEKT